MDNLSKLFNQTVIIITLYSGFALASVIKLIDSFSQNSFGYISQTLATVLILIILSLMCLNFFAKVLRYFKEDNTEKLYNITLISVFGILLYLSANNSIYSLITFSFIILYIRMELLIRTSKREKCSTQAIKFFRSYRNIYIGLIFLAALITIPLDLGILEYFNFNIYNQNEVLLLDKEVSILSQKNVFTPEFLTNYNNLKNNYYQSHTGFMVSVSLITLAIFIYAIYIIRNIIRSDNKFESDYTEIIEEFKQKFRSDTNTQDSTTNNKGNTNIFKTIILLIRPTSFIAGVITFIVSFMLGHIFFNSLILGIVVFSTSAYGFALNDYFDKDKDKINHQNRVLPLGLLSSNSVFKISISFFLFTLLIIPFLSSFQQMIAVFTLFLLTVYSYLNNRFGFLSNIITALCSSLAIVITMEYFEMSMTLIISVIVFLYILSREILLDIYDIDADKKQGKNSIPINFGENYAFIFSVIIFSLSLILTIIVSFYYDNLMLFIFMGIIGALLNIISYLNYKLKKTESSFEIFDLASRLSFGFIILAFL